MQNTLSRKKSVPTNYLQGGKATFVDAFRALIISLQNSVHQSYNGDHRSRLIIECTKIA